MIKLSNTAKNMYLRCPLSYYMHYVLKLREEKQGSALFFGTAVGDGVAEFMHGRDLKSAIKVFTEKMHNPIINNKRVDGATTKLIKYSKSDTKDGLHENPFESLLIKGQMMIEAYQKDFMPLVKNVFSIQEEIKIQNSDGDIIRGYSDAVIEHIDGRKLVMDDKTASKKYDENAVQSEDKGSQLALYYHALKDKYDLDGAGFIVMEKGIRKKQPRTRTQLLIDKPSDELINKTLDTYQEVLHNIRMGRFESKHPDCNTFFGKCICEKYQASNGEDLSGLVYVGRK